MRVVTHPKVALRRECGDRRVDPAVGVEEFLRPVGGQPVGQDLQVFGGVPGVGQRHLVGPPRPGGLLAVDVGRSGPALGRAEHDHRPRRSALVSALGVGLDRGDLVEDLVEQCGEPAVRAGMVCGVVVGDLEEVGLVAVADHQAPQLILRNTVQHSGIGDLVAVEVQHRQHHAVVGRVQELVGVPAGRQRPGLGFPVADDGDHEQVGVVEGRPVGVRQRVAQFATFVDGAGRFRGDV